MAQITWFDWLLHAADFVLTAAQYAGPSVRAAHCHTVQSNVELLPAACFAKVCEPIKLMLYFYLCDNNNIYIIHTFCQKLLFSDNNAWQKAFA